MCSQVHKRPWKKGVTRRGWEGQGTYRSRGEDAAAAEGTGLEAGDTRLEGGGGSGATLLVPVDGKRKKASKVGNVARERSVREIVCRVRKDSTYVIFSSGATAM